MLLDVRTPAEFRSTSIAGAKLMPLQQFDAARVMQEHPSGVQCVVICRGGVRAANAAQQLATAGMKGVRVLEGGMLAWEAAGLPVQRPERKPMPIEHQARIANGLWVLLGWALGTWVHPAWFALCAFMGASLVFSGVTGYCGHTQILAQMPWNRRSTAGAGEKAA